VTTTRRLAAILAADMVGYSRLMGEDEAGTLAAVRKLRAEVIEPRVSDHQGRLFKSMGDGFLVEFPSVVNAVACAAAIQNAMAVRNTNLPEDRQIQLRIGVHLGDVISEGGDVYGDGVNVAARIEGLAPSGGVAVSAMVHDNVGSRLDLAFEDMGEQQLKNIAKPMRIYRLATTSRPTVPAVAPERIKPSIAVLPFINMSGDAEQEYFADGMTEDLITDLSRHEGLIVIARNSTFAYKGKSVDARQIAKEVGVRYLLEGSARRVGAKVRINVQLIDASGGSHLWAERFDRELEDIFKVQDEVIEKIVEALVGRLTRPPPRNRPKNIDAYNLVVQAKPLMELSPQGAREAQMLLERAIAIEPNYSEAYALLSQNHWLQWAHFGAPEVPNRALALTLSRRAVELDPNDAGGHAVLGLVLAYDLLGKEASTELAKAVELDPNNADAWANLSDISVLSGRVDEGLAQIRKAFRLNPHPERWYYLLLGQAEYAACNYDAAVVALRVEETYRTNARKFLAASLAKQGRIQEAMREGEMFLISNPHWTIGHWVATQPIGNDTIREHFVTGFRMAGLPE
jgi:adenylate cyclase